MSHKNKSTAGPSKPGNAKSKKTRNLKFDNVPKSKSYNIWTRSVVIVALAVIVYFISSTKKEKKFALQKETINERFQSVLCSESYLNEIGKYPNCVPKHCGRLVTDMMVKETEVSALLSLAETGFSLGSSSGGASIMDLHSGALSQGTNFINMYQMKEAQNMLTPDVLNIYQDIKSKIINLISQRFGIDAQAIYLTKPTFFSRINNQTAKTIHDEYWHPHVDKETYPSFHYTSLLYLSNFGKEFSGGRFVFIEKGDKNLTSVIEPRRGRISIFTSGSENVHFVEKVEKGTRFAITISFTCDKEFAISNPKIINEDNSEE